MTPRLDGIDISNHQGERARYMSVQPSAIVQWAHDEGMRGVWFKASEGTTYQDPYFRAWRRQASGLGFEFRGMYHWLTPNTSVTMQLANFVAAVGDLEVGETIQLDCEQAGLTAQQVTDAYNAWVQHYGDRVLVYMGWYYGGGMVRHLDVPWWLPSYPTKPRDLTKDPIIWQWGGGSEGVYVPMLQARVDSNQIEDVGELRRLSGYPAQSQPQEGTKTMQTILERPQGYANVFAVGDFGVLAVSESLIADLGRQGVTPTVFTHRPQLLSLMSRAGITAAEMVQAGEAMPPEHQL